MKCVNRVAVVTGASGKGMGRSIALTLAREGAAVVVNYLNSRENAEAVVRCITGEGGLAAAIQGDIGVSGECERIFQFAVATFGRVDILVIGPGAGWNPEPVAALEPAKALEDVAREVGPVYNLLPLALREMAKRKWGRVIGIASNMDIPSPSYSYNAAKSARMDALKLVMAEAWPLGVTVNIVAPGPIDELPDIETATAHCGHGPAWAEREKVTPQDIAEGVAFLCSDEGRYVSGCTLTYRF